MAGDQVAGAIEKLAYLGNGPSLTGADVLVGGAGTDKFIFGGTAHSTAIAKGRDRIVDFSRAQKDKIDISGIDAKAASKKADQKFDYIGKQEFSGAAGELRFKQTAKKTFVYGDVNGDAKADFSVELAGKLNLKEDDFIL